MSPLSPSAEGLEGIRKLRKSVAQYCSTYAAATLEDETSKIIEYVFGSKGNHRDPARQVFAILVLIDRPSLIPGVVAENIRDHDLPLVQCSGTGADFQLARRSKSPRPLKCFRNAENETHFRLEVTALTKIRAKQKPHLVDVLTTFKYDNKYHLLFRWACGGNLSSLWEETDKSLSRNTVCWIAQQCWGLADGLDGIHNAKLSIEEVGQVQQPSTGPPSPTKGKSWISALKTNKKDCGRHGDIKPPNILWFKQDENDYGLGVLKISDFGLTTFHTALTTQASPRDQNGCTWTYAPPEYDLKEDISRPFDIWSLGCVYLEFITWALLGPAGIKDFRERRESEQGQLEKLVKLW
ncbi:hypothetical protein SLS64_002954 [Diaporthe eres]